MNQTRNEMNFYYEDLQELKTSSWELREKSPIGNILVESVHDFFRANHANLQV